MILPDERRRLIVDAVEREGRVLSAELAPRFSTSEDTIRRDLRDLDFAGLLRRVHGGAVKRASAEPSFREREAAAPMRKAALALAARRLIHEADIVLIDAGSTNLAIARSLSDGCAAAVITNSPDIAVALGDFSRTEIIMLGGSIAAGTGAVRGVRAARQIAEMRADLFFLGACSVDTAQGVASVCAEEAALKQAMLEVSRRVATAVTNERLGTAAPFRIAPLGSLDHLIVEADASPELLRQIGEAGEAPEILCAGSIVR